jgi:hypothetical protein
VSSCTGVVRSHAALKLLLATLLFAGIVPAALAHGVTGGDATYLRGLTGLHFVPLLYLGAKHMVTGYDHLLFLAGVVFFLYRLKDVALYATLFAIGHSTTLLLGVLAGIHANAWLVDALIGLSVVYKALENLGAFQRIGLAINPRAAVLLFGFVHGFGLATKLQDFALARDGLVGNIIAFNLGVELGQITALAAILLVLQLWRRTDSFTRSAWFANLAIMAAGFTLFGYQVTGYFAA